LSAETFERDWTVRPLPKGPGRPGVLRSLTGRAGRWGLRGVALVYLGAFIALPVAAVVSKGFGQGLTPLRDAFAQPGATAAIRLTLITSALAAVINGAFGTLLAYILVRFRFPGRGVLGALVDMPFAVPTLVTGVMLVALYGPNTPIGGFLERHGVHVIFAPAGILLALLFVTLPLVVRTVEPVLLELDVAEEEAAHVLGAGAWTTFRRVILPALRPAIAAGGLLTFARAIGEFGAIVIVSGNITGRTLTAPVFIFQLTSQFRPEDAAAVATLLFGLSFALVLVTERLVKRRKEVR
jgi:sulfate/thiosulfate transport system permease protein